MSSTYSETEGAGHISVWNVTLGIDDLSSQNRMSLCYKTMMDCIDYVFPRNSENNSYTKMWITIKNEYPTFSTGEYKHRLFFHWGFNKDPRKCLVLQQKVQEFVSQERQSEFYGIIINEQKERNSRMIRAIAQATGLPENGPDAALTTILYDVHILADYYNTITAPLVEIQTLANDIMEKGFMRLHPRIENMGKLRKEMEEICKTMGKDEEKGERIAKIIARELPKYINKYYKKTFAENGILIREDVYKKMSFKKICLTGEL